MKIIQSPAAMRRLVERWRAQGLSVGFVPTMGALHEAHLSLIRRARRTDPRTVVSVFVNPAQFGPNEDFSRYPRPFRKDAALCRGAGVHALFHPPPKAMYPEGFRTHVEVEGLSEILCGAFRPGHFRGVATVVLKLLEAVHPHRLYLGEKDYQQLVVLRRMAEDLDLPVRVIGCPTLRESDGLAMSSRNRYLDPRERAQAPLLHRALLAGARAARAGAGPARVRRVMLEKVRRVPRVRVDYMEIVDARTLARPGKIKGRMRLLGAIRVRNTRLIDNIPVIV